MITIESGRDFFDDAMSHLISRAEEVGFFLADFDAQRRCFAVRSWRPVTQAGYEYRGDFHVRLSDQTQTEIIQWASREEACLIEAHSHGDVVPAGFSGSDLLGLREWVPHCYWRLKRRPYGAIVVTADEIDALAWIDNPLHAQQVVAVRLHDGTEHATSGWTLNHRTTDTRLQADD